MITVKRIDKNSQNDVRLANEPFPLWGRLNPSYQNGQWSYSVEEYSLDARSEMCFPDENYDFDQMSNDFFFIGAYDGETCIGLAVLQNHFLKYLYLYDLKVNRNYRSKGVGKLLVDEMLVLAKEQNYRGVYATCQDNNLSACYFYLAAGFRIGGLNTEVYKGTSQEGKSDIQFYLDA